ncbi:MAG: hypothetical protein GY729_00195 [Desulfobacteraceae bacterium]|nr:hypothetical protein [Desulfobacteraceae bacterium]
MKKERPIYFNDPDELVEYVIDKVGLNITVGMCLGMGKPNHFINGLYKKAKHDQNLNLKLLTAISLEPPTWSNELEQRFMKPLVDRVWNGYVNLDYITAVRENTLPPNVKVSEFFYKAGGFMNNVHMQQNYTSTNYTHAQRDIRNNGMNVGAQLVAAKNLNGSTRFSMSCNADTSLDAFAEIRRQQKEGKQVLNVGQINFKYRGCQVPAKIIAASQKN